VGPRAVLDAVVKRKIPRNVSNLYHYNFSVFNYRLPARDYNSKTSQNPSELTN
jgi:hypothetical protein